MITIITLPLSALPILGAMISISLHFALWIGGVIIWLYMMFKTYNNRRSCFPVIGPIAEKQAGE